MSLSSLCRHAWLCGVLLSTQAFADDALDEEPAPPGYGARDARPRAAPPPLIPVASAPLASVANAPPWAPPAVDVATPVTVAPLSTPALSAAAAVPAKRPLPTHQPRIAARPPAIRNEHVHEIAVQRIPESGPHRFAPLAQVQVGGTPYYPYSFDGHVHSEHSPDADHPVAEMLLGAERAGLSALVITDHGSARSALSFPRYKGPIKTFVGQEIGGEYGHAVWWNVDAALNANASRATLAERAAYAHERGGLIVLCHPGWWIGGRAEDPMKWVTPDALRKGGISGDIDALELWNGVYDKPLPRLIAAWVDALEAGVFVPIVGNSDFHRFRAHRMGGPRNVVLCDKPDPATCLWSAVKAGRSYVTDGPTLTMSVNGKTYGERVAHGPLDVSLGVVSPRGGELRLYVGRELQRTWALSPDSHEQLHWSGPPTDGESYVRVEIVRSLAGHDAPIFELLSNPVFTR